MSNINFRYYFPGAFTNGEISVFTAVLPDGSDLVITDLKGKTLEKINTEKSLSYGSVYTFVTKRYEDVNYHYEKDGQRIEDDYVCNIKNSRPTLLPERKNDVKHLTYGRKSVFYKLHVKGFTAADPNTDKELKGTFAGLASKTNYIKDLGVNSIILMPAYEHGNTLPSGKANYWGYGDDNKYLMPCKDYALGDASAEFIELVDKMHKNGISVYMEFYFPENTDRRQAEFALRLWHDYYGVDGFSLIGCDDVIRTLIVCPYLSKASIIAPEYYYDALEQMSLRDDENKMLMHGVFRSNARSFLKGSIAAMPFAEYFLRSPKQVGLINSISDHDGFTLRDLVSFNEKHNEKNGERNLDGPVNNLSWNCGVEGSTRRKKVNDLRLRQMKNAVCYTMFSCGIPFIYAGDEFGNSQDGNNNAYCMDNKTGWVDWSNLEKYKELNDFVKSAIALRKEYFFAKDNSELTPIMSVYGKEAHRADEIRSACGIYLDRGKGVYIAINSHWESYTFSMPKDKKFDVRLSTCLPKESIIIKDGKITVPARATVVLTAN